MDQPLPPVSPPLSRELLAQRIRQALADNTSQFITPEDIRSRLLELLDSTPLLVDQGVVAGVRFSLADSTFSAFTLPPTAVGSTVRLVAYGTLAAPSLPWFADMLVDPQSSALVYEVAPRQRVAFGSDPDGSLNLSLTSSGTLTVSNRLGQATTGLVRLEV